MIGLGGRTVAVILLLVAGAILSTLLLSNLNEPSAPASRADLSLNFYLREAELTGTDDSGVVTYRLRAAAVEQDSTDLGVQLDTVDMQYGATGTTNWQLQSESGHIPADTGIISLSGNVIAALGSGAVRPMVIRTEELEIDPATRIARTEKPVTVAFESRSLDAEGMLANLESHTLQLLSDVHGHFIP